MLAFISRRLILAFLTIWAVSILAFAVIQLPPGDAVDRYIEALEEGGTSLAGGVNMGSFDEADKLAQELR